MRNILLLIYLITQCYTNNYAYKALVIVPVADLLGTPLSGTKETILHTYHNLPLTNINNDCPRLHQLLFNETVEVIGQKNHQVCITIPNVFIDNGTKQPHCTYWTLASSIIPYSELSHAHIPTSIIPEPISFKKIPYHWHTNSIVTLIAPWYDHQTTLTYSAGTRFVCAPQDQQTVEDYLTAYAIDNTKKSASIIHIPKQKALICDINMNTQEKKRLFITLLKKWAHEYHIPYVWGGCSIIDYEDQEKNKKNPKGGIDCSGLIARAAQIAGLPYHYKNSSTIAKKLPQLTVAQSIEPGDIIWIPGHVMVITNIKKNMLIEARSYEHGYGYVQEIPLHKVFNHIYSYEDLIKKIQKGETIHRIDSTGKQRDTISQIMILSL